MAENRMEIRLNRKKFLFRGGIFTVLVLAGIWLFLSYAHVQSFLTPWVVQVIAGVIVFVFGILATNDLQKVMGNPIGLVITPEGFIDHAGNLGIGIVRWKDIRQIRIEVDRSPDHLLIELIKPDVLKKKIVNPLQQNLMNTNIKLYGTPVVIHADNLVLPSSELLRICQAHL